MQSITVISIIVIAILTILIFLFLLLSYKSILRNYMTEVELGKHDEEIYEEYLKEEKRKTKKWLFIFTIFKYLVLLFLICIIVLSILYRINSQVINIDGNYSFVVASGSMSKFYNTEYEEYLKNTVSDNLEQLQIGDICFFKSASSLEIGKIYGYKINGQIVIHRLIEIIETNDGQLYRFKGDANNAADLDLIKADSVLYEYTGNHIRYLGFFILYYQSTLGVYSFINIIIILILLDKSYYSYNKINNNRLKKIMEN